MTTSPDILSQLNLAEGLRRDEKYAEALRQFEALDGALAADNPAWGWCCAHHGAAACAAFVPHDNKENSLDAAKSYLTQAVDHDAGYSWAWARLGEVYRLLGNLPPFRFHWRQPDSSQPGSYQLHANDAWFNYQHSEACFTTALKLDGDNPWVKAHKAAMLLNKRRLSLLDSAEFGDLKNSFNELRYLLYESRRSRHGYYPWAVFYSGVEIYMESLVSLMEDPRVQVVVEENRGLLGFMWSGYYMSMSLYQDPSPIYQNAMQPGTIGLDPWMGLTYDFLDFLPRAIAWLNDPSDANGQKAIGYWDIINEVIEGAHLFRRPDKFLARSGDVRFAYANHVVKSIEMVALDRSSIDLSWATKIHDDATSIIAALKNQYAAGSLLNTQALGNGFLLRMLDVMTILVKTAALLRIAADRMESGSAEAHQTRALSDALAGALDDDHLKKRLPVFKLSGIDTVTWMYDRVKPAAPDRFLNAANLWLVLPVWSFPKTGAKALNDILHIEWPATITS